MTQLIHKKGNYTEWLLPEKLYHGTTDKYLESILKDGLKVNHEQKNSALSLPMIYMTSSIEMAKDFADSVTYRQGGNPIVLEIDSNQLEADLIGFDLNISLRLSSQCVTYQKSILIKNTISELKNFKPGKMIFEEPDSLMIPVVWNLHEPKTLTHLESIGYTFPIINVIKRKL